MTIRVAASPGAAPSDRDAAKASRELLADELSRVRTGALAWRNGLAALLAYPDSASSRDAPTSPSSPHRMQPLRAACSPPPWS